MIRIKRSVVTIVVLSGVMAAGCGGDMAQQLMSNASLRTQVMSVIASHSDLAGQVADKLLAADSTRTALVQRLMSNSDAAQQVMVMVAKNQTMVDGVIGLAVQDPAMKEHVLALLKGMEMVKGK